MKTILCYGDSNTFGYKPSDGMRYPKEIRWTGQLSNLLGFNYHVVEEGCNGRTTIFDDPHDPWKNGYTYLKPCLNSHKPIDILIFMLGTNDLKFVFHSELSQIAAGMEQLVRESQQFLKQEQGFQPQIIIVSPPIIGAHIMESSFKDEFDSRSVENSYELARYYRDIAIKYDCGFVDAANYVEVSEIDSLHLTPEGHENLAIVLYNMINKL